MDRSFLSAQDVITASRKFVCIRLTSYENEGETAFCRSLMIGRSGDVENTTVTILAPDGKKQLTRVSRSTKGIFDDAADMARQMNQLAAQFPVTTNDTLVVLPIAITPRIGLDVAACDNQPLVLVIAKEESKRIELEALLSTLAWLPEFIGKMAYATAALPSELKSVAAIPDSDGIAIIEPDVFGQTGKLMQFIAEGESAEQIAQALRKSLSAFQVTSKQRQSHRLAGTQLGVFWETKYPVTDAEEAAARLRTQKEIERRRIAK